MVTRLLLLGLCMSMPFAGSTNIKEAVVQSETTALYDYTDMFE